MEKVFIRENLQGERLKELLLFAKTRSNNISISTYYKGSLSYEEFKRIQDEYKTYIVEEDKKRRISYNKNIEAYRNRINKFCKTDKDAVEYFNKLLELELSVLNSLEYEEFNNKNKVQEFTRESDYICSRFTRISPVTRGPIFKLYYYDFGDTYSKIISSLDKLFKYPYLIDNNEFEDLTYYNGIRKILALCSHEEYAYMELENSEYKELIELGILSEFE